MCSCKATVNHLRLIAEKAGAALCAAVLTGIAGCGGGESLDTPQLPPPQTVFVPIPPPPPPPPPLVSYSVVVKTVDTEGNPVAGVRVGLYGIDGSWRTDSDGIATFSFSTRSTDAYVGTYADGYYPASRRFQLVDASDANVQQLTLIRTDEMRLAVLGTTSEKSADASSVVVSLDLGVLDRNGAPVASLTSADFVPPSGSCDPLGGACISDTNSMQNLDISWSASVTTPVKVTVPTVGQSTNYNIRFVLESEPGVFTAGRTVFTWIHVRLGADTWVEIQIETRL